MYAQDHGIKGPAAKVMQNAEGVHPRIVSEGSRDENETIILLQAQMRGHQTRKAMHEDPTPVHQEWDKQTCTDMTSPTLRTLLPAYKKRQSEPQRKTLLLEDHVNLPNEPTAEPVINME